MAARAALLGEDVLRVVGEVQKALPLPKSTPFKRQDAAIRIQQIYAAALSSLDLGLEPVDIEKFRTAIGIRVEGGQTVYYNLFETDDVLRKMLRLLLGGPEIEGFRRRRLLDLAEPLIQFAGFSLVG